MTVQVSVLKMKESTFILLLYDKYSHNILKDKSSAWFNFVLQSLERFTVKKNLNTETEKSEQTLFAQISLSQYEDCSTVNATNHFKDHDKKGPCETFTSV